MDDYDEELYGGYPSAIYAAAREGNVEELRRLIAQGHVVALEPEPFGPTVLNSIAKSGDTEVMRMLLDADNAKILMLIHSRSGHTLDHSHSELKSVPSLKVIRKQIAQIL